MAKSDYAYLYRLPIWRGEDGLRAQCLRRDSRLCRMCGILCDGKRHTPTSPVADHITPHQGDFALFAALDNLQTLCKRCHDSTKAAQEARGYSGVIDDTGWPIDPAHPANRR